jgi:hypothetical protein
LLTDNEIKLAENGHPVISDGDWCYIITKLDNKDDILYYHYNYFSMHDYPYIELIDDFINAEDFHDKKDRLVTKHEFQKIKLFLML